jgi:antitoxin component of RelBE/YafQ-DinJ toxin-antitoxin module
VFLFLVKKIDCGSWSLRGGLPFSVAIPNKLTASTLKKSRRGEDIQEFESLEAMFKDWER